MPIRLSGLSSGLDTESIVSALVSSYDYKKQKYVKAQTKLSWTQDAWQSLNTKIYSLYSSVGNMRYSDSYALKKTTVSDSSKAKITASGTAANGVQSLKINKMAKAGYLTSAKLDDSTASGSLLNELGYTGGSGKIDVTVGDKTTTLDINENTSISIFLGQLKEVGLTASYDDSNKRIFISSSSTGESNNFSITAGDENGIAALESFGLLTASDLSSSSSNVFNSDFTSKIPGITTTKTGGKLTAINYDIKATEDAVMTAVNALKDAYAKQISGTDDEKAAAEQTIKDYQDYTALVAFSSDDYLQSDAETLKNAMMQKINSTVAYEAQKANITTNVINADQVSSATKAGLDRTFDTSKFGTKVEGQDAEIELNGAVFTSSKNSFSINGLTIEALGETTDTLTVTTSTDTAGLYDKVKEFLSSYNSVINEMMKLYNADSAKDYEPLTDDEKSAMSDNEIEKWEQKIKDSLLRRDTTLGSLITTMTTAMMGTVEVNGENVSWGTFGVQTLGFLNAEKNENYAYHIDGDSEDSASSGKEDKLQAALATDPDKVISFMQGIASNLYKAVDNKMKSTAVSSVYKVYNDKEMASEYSNYSDLIKTWTTRVSDLEESYYKKFAAMESALATLQNSSSSLSSLLG